ncbi:aspartic proteinase CDR1-like [Cucurbita moschata]|uniref:Aspartic proteinase CDR1-like n=1 Tax=Cucurbita moschata TaxID=3662 RepID=A0A6J1FP39_CUCMO|nr:aspartic proteinase CDR1-like [Cucurbita moschata]
MAAISIFFCLFLISFSQATAHGGVGGGGHGFTTSLFHRDSFLSPLYNPSLSHYDRLTNAFRRSFSRSDTLLNRAAAVSITGIHSRIIPDDGEFLMSISIGTPRVKIMAIADTGSDLTWTQCMPCHKCFNQSFPIFNPRRSFSYRHVSCTSNACRSLDDYRCGPDNRTCSYGYSYGDQSFTYGDLASEKITIGSFKLYKTLIGCGHVNGGTFSEDTSGIIGLGGGPLSLISQMRKIAAVKRRFSYCLPTFFSDKNVTGKISFGKKAIVSGRKVVSTPLVLKEPNTFYYLTLEAMSVANKRFKAANNMSTAVEQGNILIDSGTTLTILPQNLYKGVASTLAHVVKAKRVNDPTGVLDLCFAACSVDHLNIPVITAHFAGNADVKLLPLNTFAMVADNVACLAFVPSANFAIFGNLAQVNFLVGYDLERKRLSFKYNVCA